MWPKPKATLRSYIANGHGAWEAALANMACHGDRVLVAATGWFAHGWAKMARAMGIEADIVEYGTQSTIDIDALETALRAYPSDYYKTVLVTHVDTSTSVKNDIAAVRTLLDDLGSQCVAGGGLRSIIGVR
jgi:alanine-glyoxylate transaminase/serine-glyoxylate transaminase/serine-pyruvate transaminase